MIVLIIFDQKSFKCAKSEVMFTKSRDFINLHNTNKKIIIIK